MTQTGRGVDASAAPGGWRGLPLIYRVSYLVAVGLVVSGIVHLGIAGMSDRPWAGPLSWRKAATFGLSFGITLAAVVWVVSLLPGTTRARQALVGILAFDCVVEVVGITVQVWRHVPSHFNKETPFDAAVANMLAGGGGVLIVVLTALAAIAVPGGRGLRPSLRLGVSAGFGLLLVGLAAGVAMIVRGISALDETSVDGVWDDPAYAEAGFVKEFHGVTLHAVLALPALGVVLSRLPLTERLRVQVMAAAIGLYGVAAGVVLSSNLNGA